MERQSKGALIGLGIVVLLASLWWGYRQWQHHKLAMALHDPDPVVRIWAVRSAAKADQPEILIEAFWPAEKRVPARTLPATQNGGWWR